MNKLNSDNIFYLFTLNRCHFDSGKIKWGARSANSKLVPCECSRQTVLGQTALLSTKTPSVHLRPIGAKQNCSAYMSRHSK